MRTASALSRPCSRGNWPSTRNVIPIPGARRAASITDSANAAHLELTADEVTRLSESVGLFD